MSLTPGLYIVATPIGNLGDITFRAVETLKASDKILAEDTRHSRWLLNHYQISVECESYNDFNKEKRSPGILAELKEKKTISLISDAGTPGIADPAFYLVRMARQEGIPVYPIPGPVAGISALVASGLPTDHFLFANFPPKKSAARLNQLQAYKEMYHEDVKWAPTIVYYIGTMQLKKFLNEIETVFGSHTIVALARELTKKFEEISVKSVQEHIAIYQNKNPKGEFVLLFHPQNKG